VAAGDWCTATESSQSRSPCADARRYMEFDIHILDALVVVAIIKDKKNSYS
jgi:hypothetical protein